MKFYSILSFVVLFTFFLNLAAHSHEREGLCEAIRNGDELLFDRYINIQDINVCKYEQNLPTSARVTGGVLGTLILPMAPLFWYTACHEEPETPLSMAVWYKRIAMTLNLINRKADVNKQDPNGYTALHWACSAWLSQDTYNELVKCLLDAGAKPSLYLKDSKGYTPLHWATVRGNARIAQTLIMKGAPIDAQDNDGATPLHCAYELDDKKMIALLHEHGAQSLPDNKGNYPKDMLTLKKLIQKAADQRHSSNG